MDSPSHKIRTVALVCTALNILGGLSRHILQLYLHLNRKKFRVIIVYYSRNKDVVESFFINGGVKPADLMFVPLSKEDLFVLGIFKLADILRRESVSLVHTFLLHSDLLGYAAARLADVPVFVSSVEGKLLPDEVNGVRGIKKYIYRFLNSLLRKNFDLTIAVSQDLKNEVLNVSHGVKDVKVIPVGISSHIPYEQLPNRTRKPVYTIGCLSQLNKDKGVEHLLRSVPYVKQRLPNVRFLIAGTGEEELSLKTLVRHLNIEEQVSFFGWVRDIQTFLLGLDVFVIPSLREGCPASLLEAMSLARPAVGFEVPGVKEIIRHGETGVLVTPFDLKRFAEEIVMLCDDADYAQQLGRRGKELVESRFSVEHELELIELEYSRLMLQ